MGGGYAREAWWDECFEGAAVDGRRELWLTLGLRDFPPVTELVPLNHDMTLDGVERCGVVGAMVRSVVSACVFGGVGLEVWMLVAEGQCCQCVCELCV